MSILFQLCFFFTFCSALLHTEAEPATSVNCSRGEREYSCKKGLLLRAHKLSRESFYRFIRSKINRKNRQEKQFMQDKRENYYKTSFFCALLVHNFPWPKRLLLLSSTPRQRYTDITRNSRKFSTSFAVVAIIVVGVSRHTATTTPTTLRRAERDDEIVCHFHQVLSFVI